MRHELQELSKRTSNGMNKRLLLRQLAGVVLGEPHRLITNASGDGASSYWTVAFGLLQYRIASGNIWAMDGFSGLTSENSSIFSVD